MVGSSGRLPTCAPDPPGSDARVLQRAANSAAPRAARTRCSPPGGGRRPAPQRLPALPFAPGPGSHLSCCGLLRGVLAVSVGLRAWQGRARGARSRRTGGEGERGSPGQRLQWAGGPGSLAGLGPNSFPSLIWRRTCSSGIPESPFRTSSVTSAPQG